ncbi:hypothetical protein [Streptomyces sp. NPDC053048]|uniref:hypothetical protein n=1 Tax=Streptomyces sp. NPDC053048 TaxID=3365694 RepID=UPI0037D4B9D5
MLWWQTGDGVEDLTRIRVGGVPQADDAGGLVLVEVLIRTNGLDGERLFLRSRLPGRPVRAARPGKRETGVGFAGTDGLVFSVGSITPDVVRALAPR